MAIGHLQIHRGQFQLIAAGEADVGGPAFRTFERPGLQLGFEAAGVARKLHAEVACIERRVRGQRSMPGQLEGLGQQRGIDLSQSSDANLDPRDARRPVPLGLSGSLIENRQDD
jgi:hypothetical protein